MTLLDRMQEAARREREYRLAQTGEWVRVANQILALTAERDSLRAERDALTLQVSILTNERDNAQARSDQQ